MTLIRLHAVAELEDTVTNILVAHGADRNEAAAEARGLVWADAVGRHPYGVEWLAILAKRLRSGVTVSPCHSTFEDRSPANAILHGNHGLGRFLGRRAMEKAVSKARGVGIGAVAVNNSQHFGAASYHALRAAEQNMIGIAMSNSYPKVAAHGGKTPVLGTNPIAFAIPRTNGRPILVDFAVSRLAGSTLREKVRLNESLPKGLMVDEAGNPITDPNKTGTLLPMAGAKGFGLSIVIEVLSGVMSMAGFSTQINSSRNDFENPSRSGHFLVALNLDSFLPTSLFSERLEELIEIVLTDPEVRLPGDLRWDAYDRAQRKGFELSEDSAEIIHKLQTDGL